MATLSQQIIEIVQAVLKPSVELRPELEFINDLGANSLDITEIAMRIEERFGITVPDEQIEAVRTLADAIAFVEQATAEREGPRAAAAVVAIGSDHAGFHLKQALLERLGALSWEVLDCGPSSPAACDYPSYALEVARAVASKRARFGVLVCATGIGMSIAANKVPGVRAALVHGPYEASATRRHNDANVLCLGAQIVGSGIAVAALETFLKTPFEPGDDGRHQRRVELILRAEDGIKR
ncbi:MAG: ribose 5-phosphate isomerase B [Myxococcota bacterium]|nr:ribose 5-phosphate isomerase B [Myxococcota bacterium]